VGRVGDKTGACVLIVEDDADTCAMLVEHFRGEGYRVVTAKNGNEAVATALASHPDVVVLDIMLPVLDGWEVAKLLRSYVATRATPMVMCTARREALDTWRAKEMGCELLFKPCTPQEVEDVTWALLRGGAPANA
jgi:DNA-binding response OmpR family regulator